MGGSVRLAIALTRIERAAEKAREAGRFSDATSAVAQAGAEVLLGALQAEAPVRSGKLRASIVARDNGANGYGFYGVRYGKLVVHGTRPHVILPRTKRALFWPGAGHPLRRVQHPGTKPSSFPARAVQRSLPALLLLLRDDGRRVVRLIVGGAS
ncbi:MAG TPA: HK97 gp10 family phage protein [Chloroflexota bacterium]|nr:HK97 gp10 family phage protein [Chloroflexota bacterium]